MSDRFHVFRVKPVRRHRRPYTFVNTGTLFLQTVSATASGAVTVRKSAGKIIAATGTGAVSVRITVGKVISATGTGTVTMIKGVLKTVAATAFGSVIISTVRPVAQLLRRALYIRGVSYWRGRSS